MLDGDDEVGRGSRQGHRRRLEELGEAKPGPDERRPSSVTVVGGEAEDSTGANSSWTPVGVVGGKKKGLFGWGGGKKSSGRGW